MNTCMRSIYTMKILQTNSKTLVCFHLLYEGHDIRVYHGGLSDIINDISLIYRWYIGIFCIPSSEIYLIIDMLQCWRVWRLDGPHTIMYNTAVLSFVLYKTNPYRTCPFWCWFSILVLRGFSVMWHPCTHSAHCRMAIENRDNTIMNVTPG